MNKMIVNKRLFIAFFVINAAGYDYENNPKGSNPIRMKFRKIADELFSESNQFRNIISSIRSLPLATKEYIRLANFFIFDNFKNDSKDDNELDKIIKLKFEEIKLDLENLYRSPAVARLFEDYCVDVNSYYSIDEQEIKKEITNVLTFFNLSESDIDLNLEININFLDSYCRGTNYYRPFKQIISCSLNIEDKFNFSTFRHELMHIILKHLYHNDLSKYDGIIPVNSNYSQDSQRTKFEENFILAANLFFILDEQKRKNNLKYFKDIGYLKIEKMYSIIEEYFTKQKLPLNKQTMDVVVDEF